MSDMPEEAPSWLIRSPLRWLLWILAAVVLVWGLARLASGPRIAPGSVLVMDLGGMYPDAPEAGLPAWLTGRSASDPSTLPGLLQQLETAARDDRLHAVVFRIRDLDVGWAKAQELHSAIAALGPAGRKTAAYLEVEGFDAGVEYYIASAADGVYMPPGGQPPIVGMVSLHFFLGGLWDKLGIQLEMERIGVYKSVGEQLAARSMSEPYREMAESLLQSVWSQVRLGIEASRGLAPETLEAVLEDPAMPLAALEELGLIDGVKRFPEVVATVAEGLTAPRVRGDVYREVDASDLGAAPVARIAVIYASGPVVLAAAPALPGSPLVSPERIGVALQHASEDPRIRAIVLRIDSPGGSALASELIWQSVRDAGRRKPVIASLSDVAASGGYYIASAAHRIVSDPATLTGSIGVVTLHPSIGGGLSRLGVHTELVEIGPHARLVQSIRPLAPRTEEVQGRSVARVYRQFLERVAEGRQLPIEQVDALARGRVWTGAQAHEAGLVDTLGGLREALIEAKRAAGLETDADVIQVPYPEPRGWLQYWLQSRAGMQPLSAREELRAALHSLPASDPVGQALLPSLFPSRTPLLLAPHPVVVR